MFCVSSRSNIQIQTDEWHENEVLKEKEEEENNIPRHMCKIQMIVCTHNAESVQTFRVVMLG